MIDSIIKISADPRPISLRIYETYTGMPANEATWHSLNAELRSLLEIDKHEQKKNSEREIAKILISFFIGQFKSWSP